MEYILKSIKKKKIPINPAVVISNKSNTKGLKIAEKLGINIEIIESKNFKKFVSKKSLIEIHNFSSKLSSSLKLN